MLNKKAIGIPRSPVIGGTKPLIAPGATTAFRGKGVKKDVGFLLEEKKQNHDHVKPKLSQLTIEAGGLGPILTPGTNVVTGTGQTLRANRFTPTPW